MKRITVTIKGEAVLLDTGEAMVLLNSLRTQLSVPPKAQITDFLEGGLEGYPNMKIALSPTPEV